MHTSLSAADPDPTLHGLCLKPPPALTCCPRSAVKSLVLSPSCSPPGCGQDLESQDPASSSPCLPQSLYLRTHLLNRITALIDAGNDSPSSRLHETIKKPNSYAVDNQICTGAYIHLTEEGIEKEKQISWSDESE